MSKAKENFSEEVALSGEEEEEESYGEEDFLEEGEESEEL